MFRVDQGRIVGPVIADMVAWFCVDQGRAEGPMFAFSPGQRPGLVDVVCRRPVRAKAQFANRYLSSLVCHIRLVVCLVCSFALTGRKCVIHFTQGVALG